MNFHVFTLFPAMFQGPLSESILKRAQEKGLLNVTLHDIRDYAEDKRRIVDDYAYGGGPGMVMKPEPVFKAVEAQLERIREAQADSAAVPVILMSPKGRALTQDVARDLARHTNVVLICGRYEGVDQRIIDHLATDEISIGDYVLTGGELAAMVVIDCVTRLGPGVLGSGESTSRESHTDGLLQYPQYTRPPDYRGWTVPEVLLSGHHARIEEWRREQSLLETRRRRPEMLEGSKDARGNSTDN